MQYFIVVGKTPMLSLAEICSVCSDIRIIQSTGNAIIFETNKTLDVQKLQARLGGTIKTGEILTEMDRGATGEEIVESLHSFITAKNRKVHFGISLYNAGNEKEYMFLKQNIKSLGLSLKKLLREDGASVRFVTSRDMSELSSVIVSKNHLLDESGSEFILVCGERLWIGRTRAVQDFETYSYYDYERPARDCIAGMLPPKLAKMLINLSRTEPKTARILDPFCGSGTILQEAVRLGYEHIIGSDVSPKAISHAKKNLIWLQKKYPSLTITNTLGNTSSQVCMFEKDATHLTETIPKHSIDAIITEPYLGPALTGRENDGEVRNNIASIEKLYNTSLSEFSQILKPNGRLIIIIPHFRHNGGGMMTSPKIHSLAKFQRISWHCLPKYTPLFYERPEQRVVREIGVFLVKKEM